MIRFYFKFFLLVVIQILVLIESKEVQREGRDYHGYYPAEEEKYQIFQYPGYFPFKEEREKNPGFSLMDKGINFLLLKLGIFGIIKAVAALIFLGFLIKVPLMLLKLSFLKSFFLPFLLAPLFMHMFTNQMTQTSDAGMAEKPSDTPSGTPSDENIMGLSDMNMIGRQLSDNLTSIAWQSVKMFAESDQCVERISCIIGASNKDSSLGLLLSRMLKYLHYSASPESKERFSAIREAFNRGATTSICLDEDYKCNNPELLIQHGSTKVKIL